MLLEENKNYKIKELAEWFDLSPKTLSCNRKKYLNILSKYCSFDDNQRKGIFVKKIIIPEYIPQASTRSIVEEEFLNEWKNDSGDLINTCKNVAENIYDKRQEDFSVKPVTVYHTTCVVRREWYGVPKGTGGIKGHCKYTLAVLNEDGTQYRYFTPEENKIKRQLIKKYFSNPEETIEETCLLMEAYKKKELTAEEYNQSLAEMYSQTLWTEFLIELESAIGCRCARVTELIDCGFSEVEGEA